VFKWPNARHIYLSPHLDDTVLSCGGTLFQQAQAGESVAVVTVFAGSPPPDQVLSPIESELHERWQQGLPDNHFPDPPAMRRQEDLQSLKTLSADIQVMHLSYLDCIYRRGPGGEALYDSNSAIFGEIHPKEPMLEVLASIGPPADSVVYAPLGIGHHVDHQIVHQWVRGWNLPTTNVRYYEDYPYVADAEAAQKRLAELPGWTCHAEKITPAALRAKIEAVACHRSQIGSFWVDTAAMSEALTDQIRDVGGERYWSPAFGGD
jgi:LmbE family N-acetylglucosaminyl deacetylase